MRLAHYQHDQQLVRECDRLGLLAWAELPVYWGIAFEQPHVLEQARQQLDELIIRDRKLTFEALRAYYAELASEDVRARKGPSE